MIYMVMLPLFAKMLLLPLGNMGLVITFFVLLSLVFTIHNGNPRSNNIVSGYIIAKFANMSMAQCCCARYSSA